jgi:hypothetical protein
VAATCETLLQINAVKIVRLTTTGDRKKQAMDPFVWQAMSRPSVGFPEPQDNKVNLISNRPRANNNYHSFVTSAVVLS